MKISSFLLGFSTASRLWKSMLIGGLIFVKSGSIEFAAQSVLFLLFSFLFNDFVDIKKDALGAFTKASVLQLITRFQLGAAALSVLVLAILIEIWMPLSYGLTSFVVCYLTSLVYSCYLKRVVPAVGTPIWCVVVVYLMLLPFEVGVFEKIAAILFFFGRELLLDLRDANVDIQYCDTASLPVILGAKSTLIFASTLELFGAVAMLVAKDLISFQIALLIGGFVLASLITFIQFIDLQSIKSSLLRFGSLGVVLYFIA